MTRIVSHDNFGNTGAVPSGIDRNEPMHLTVKSDRLEHTAAIGLERATVIVKRHAGNTRNEIIRHPAYKVSPESGILPIASPSGNNVESLIELGQKKRNVLRVILQIGIDRDDDVPLRMIDSSHDSCGLAIVAA